jgi:uncharacterized glyoxalase superfamily protein PhnB
MPRVSTYLNFPGTAEEAFSFYRSVFGTDLQGPVYRMGDMPPAPGQPPLREDERSKVMHAELPILAGPCRSPVPADSARTGGRTPGVPPPGTWVWSPGGMPRCTGSPG